ncbi:MAG TPA: DNA helicase RecG, partial [Microthrixaceae bacterium]|nr:DNA helicase RecG [Microthrixaceae bacterium]
MAESPAAPPRDARPITLRDLAGMEVQRLAGVGPKTLTGLHHLGIESILDLVSHYPRRYLDRTRQATIRDLRAGEEGMVLATVQSIESRRVRG